MKKINVVLVGLGFGGAFGNIYRDHPDVETVGLYDANPDVLKAFSDYSGIKKLYYSFEDVLNDPNVDAVHLVTPIPLHEEQTVRVLESGKHCACTVPMAISLDGLRRITEAVRKSGKNYMMMETALYTAHFLMAKKMKDSGEFGNIQFLRGAHYQDMENWPSYWMGLPPMFYGTHAISPMVVLSGSRIKEVYGFGSGTMREELTREYKNPYPVECAALSFENGLRGEVTRSLFETVRNYTESFNVYGSLKTFEWAQIESEQPLVMELVIPENSAGRGYGDIVKRVNPPNEYMLLPKEIQKYTVRSEGYDETNPQDTLNEGASGGHGGSHPHLVHEFVRSIIEGRKSHIDEVLAANITGAGICAHLSAMSGQPEEVPVF